MRRLIIVSLAVLSGPALWSCGLEMCSLPSAEAPRAGSFQTRYDARSTGFRADGVEGRYHQAVARGEYRTARNWSFGGAASYTSLSAGGHTESGAGNPVLFVEYAPGAAVFGSQLEVPVRSAASAIASNHYEWMPYAGWTEESGPVRWHGRAGLLVALSGDHGRGHAHSPLYVNPHAEKQLAARVGARLPRAAGADVYLDAQRALSGGHSDNQLSAGVSATVRAGRVELRPSAELPLTGGTRARWRAGLVLTGRL